MEVRMIRRKTGQLREDGVTVLLIKDLCPKVEGAQPGTNAASLDGKLLAGDKQLPTEPLSPHLGVLPTSHQSSATTTS